MKFLNIGQKLALIGLLFLIPFAIVTYIMVSSINSEKVDFAKLELMGTEYYTPLSALLMDLQQHNSASATWLSGDAGGKDNVEQQEHDIAVDISKVNEVNGRLESALHTSVEWQKVRNMIIDLLAETPKLSASQSLVQHQNVIDATVLLISKVSDNSKLTLDPDIDTYYLMNTIMFQGPATSDFLSQARSLCTRMAASKTGKPEQFDELHRLAILADFSQDGVADSLSRVMAYNQSVVPELEPKTEANAAAVKEVTDALRDLVANHRLPIGAANTDQTMTKNINLLFDLEARATEVLNRLLKIRLTYWQHEIDYALAGAGLGLLLVLIIGFYIMRDITVPLQRVVGIANQIAQGDRNYSIRALKQSDDEVGILIDAFNEMLNQIQERDGDLQKSHNELEKRVAERTKEVVNSLSFVHATLESTTDAILAIDVNGDVTNFNERFLELWRIPRGPNGVVANQSVCDIDSSLFAEYQFFLTKMRELLWRPEDESFDLVEFLDGRVIEQYSKPQRVQEKCVGRVWSFRDITERKRAESEMERMHRELIDTSRQAGMAEVATSVLHNVGNVLNSLNVSSTVVTSQIQKSKVANLPKIVALMKEHEADIGDFLTSDPKGRQLPGYLSQLAGHLLGEQNTALKELHLLQENIDHIKDIVVRQQSYAKISGVVETVNIKDLIEDALRLNQCSLQRHGVEVLREFEAVPSIDVERHKVLQILVNLVRNATHACDDSARIDKRMTLRVSQTHNGIKISVADNGIGIPKENLTRIFSHGFTTRKEGHGFGLHSAVLAAKEMGGSLIVLSEGPNQGAVFELELPLMLAKPG